MKPPLKSSQKKNDTGRDGLSQWELDKALAAGLLAQRKSRRQFLSGFAILMLLMLALGLWGIDDWLEETPLRYLIYWSFCGLLSGFVILFALYDMLVTFKEERGKK